MLSSVFLVGKLAGQQVDEFSLPVSSTRSSLVYLLDKLFSQGFLVASSGVKLLTADGSSVSCSGSWIIPLPFGAAVLTGCSSWLRFLFLSSERIFSVITTFY